MNFRRVIALLLVLMLAVSLTACGGGGGSAKDDGNKTITFWSVFTGGDGTAMQKIIDAYNATNPEYTVEHIMVEQGELYTKLPLVVNSQEGVPDLVIQHVDRLASNVKGNMYQNMNDYIAANGKIKGENYIESAWNLGEIDGNRYGIPMDVHSYQVPLEGKVMAAKPLSSVVTEPVALPMLSP